MDKSKVRILLVDDYEVVRVRMRKELGVLGYNNVDDVGSGREALEKMKHSLAVDAPYAMVFCDWMMPEMDGLQVIKTAQASETLRSIPIVMVTAESEQDSVFTAVQAGAAGYIMKPIEMDKLRSKIEGILTKRKGPSVTAKAPNLAATVEKSISLDQDLADHVARAVDLTFSRMLETPATVEKIELDRKMSQSSDVFGVIDMVQRQVYGTFALSFPRSTIFNIMEQFYGQAFSEVDSSVRMGVGELTNVTFAVMKASLNLNGYDFQMAIPQVVAGAAAQETSQQESAMDVHFSTKFGKFWVTISCPHGGKRTVNVA